MNFRFAELLVWQNGRKIDTRGNVSHRKKTEEKLTGDLQQDQPTLLDTVKIIAVRRKREQAEGIHMNDQNCGKDIDHHHHTR